MITVKHTIPQYEYLGFITDAIKNSEPFKYTEINQLGARLSGKTTSDNIELIRAIIYAAKQRKPLFIMILRMRH